MVKKFEPYTVEEDLSMIAFVLKHNMVDRMKGRAVWKMAADEQLCSGRTWESMKVRFRKEILPKIDQYDLNQEDRYSIYMPLS